MNKLKIKTATSCVYVCVLSTLTYTRSLAPPQVILPCVDAFRKDVPNYILNDMRTVNDVIVFFSRPAIADVRARDLPLFHSLENEAAPPPNLYIQR